MDNLEAQMETALNEKRPKSCNDYQKEDISWYIFSILVRLGRPSLPEEISEKCSLLSISPLEVESLCRITQSPLCITEGRLVTCSEFSVSLFTNLCGKSAPDSKSTCYSKEIKGEPVSLKSPRKRVGEELVHTGTSFRKASKTPKLQASVHIENYIPSETPSASGRHCCNHPKNSANFEVAHGSVGGQAHRHGTNETCQNVWYRLSGNDCNASHPKMNRGNSVVLDSCKESNKLESIVMTDVQMVSKPDVEMPIPLDISTVSNPECLAVDSCNQTKAVPSNENDLNNKGVADCKGADVVSQNMETANSKIPLESKQLPENLEGKDDCTLTYKRRKGEICVNQLGCINKEAMLHQFGCINQEGPLHPDSCKADPKICVPIVPVQNGGDLDGTAAIKLEEVNCRADQAILEGDLVVSLQAFTSLADTNMVAKGECTEQFQLADYCITHDAPRKSVVENIVKYDDGKCNIPKEDESLKPDLPCKKLDACQKDNKTKIRETHANLEKFSTAKERTKIKKNGKALAVVKDGTNAAGPLTTKNDGESKRIPFFESFTVEEEEGSGGYGTVYKARRKQDGKIFAIKCPLEKTPTNYVNNEIKMLERFGGRPFIIKYEGVFKDNGCDCLILEHVEHEKPEVLKREIDVSQLRWYGYCMFKALSILHKNGVIHRDVKPGNFLFSRKLNEGYLIDFNLAAEQHDLNATGMKPKMLPHGQRSVVGAVNQKPPIFNRRGIPSNSANSRQKTLLAAAAVSSQTKDAMSFTKKPREGYIGQSGNVNLRKGMPTTEVKQPGPGNGKAHRNYPPDVRDTRRKLGGVEPAKIPAFNLLVSPSKEITSARTPSGGERLREPLPCQGRKELINFAQETRQSPQHQATLVPVSQRKRVAASPERVARESANVIHVSPMPLHPSLNTTTYGVPKNKGTQKCRRDGPFAGTKGYRAPEVLLRSLYQGVKLDIWSAGVSLLYLMVGKTPFQANSTDQAIKDIAKMRGKEEVWEIARIHDRESSLPEDLYSDRFENGSIEEWCKKNTKRPDFLDCIPASLFDLVNKCLCVNPRLRIDAEGALNHEFFAPCRDAFKKRRLLSRESVSTELSGPSC